MINEAQAPRLAVPVSDRDHIRGPMNAPVTLVEYGDYQCDNCGEAFPIVQRVRARLGDQLRFAFRNFPLVEIHEYAAIAAEAAEAAGAHGKFWEMHDTLMQNQTALTPEDLIGYAQRLGLDTDRFTRDLENHTFAQRIIDDFQGGERSGVEGTPTFFIAGVMYEDSYDFESLMDALTRAEGRAERRKPRGQPKRTLRHGRA